MSRKEEKKRQARARREQLQQERREPAKRGWSMRGALAKVAVGTAVVGIVAFLGGVEKLGEYWQKAWSATFRYPVEIEPVGQRGTDAGYLLHLRIRSTSGSTVFIPTDQFRLKIVRDERVESGLPAEERKKLVYGEVVRVFDDALIVQAVLAGRTFANAATNIACGKEPRDLYLLLTVAGPGDPSLGDRLRLARAYRSLRVSVRRRFLVQEYLDVPIRRRLVLALDEKTIVREK